MNTISFMTANYVARQVGYHVTEGWGQGDTATQDYFRPAETFASRFDEYLSDVKAMGFEAIDLWLAILNPAWLTPEHVDAAKDLLAKHNLSVASLAGWFDHLGNFETACKLASALGTSVLGGGSPLLRSERAAMIDCLKAYGLKLGIENHPEKNAAELRAQIGDGADGLIGAAVDTGWFGTHGYDAPRALEELKDFLFHIHLKDVRAVGGHDTCQLGQGVVDIPRCAQTLKRIGYTGAISIEHEPFEYDPTDEIRASYAALKEWLV